MTRPADTDAILSDKELIALDIARQRRMEAALAQEAELNSRKSNVFVNVTWRITDSERRLISFITKFLSLDMILDISVADLTNL